MWIMAYTGGVSVMSKKSAEDYINSEFWLGIEAHPNLLNFSKDIFGVAPISSVSNGIPVL